MENLLDKIVHLLEQSPGKSFSEVEIGSSLAISPSSVRKQIQDLKKKGYEIDNHEGGLTLKQAPDFLKPQQIQTYLKTNFIGRDLHYFPEVNSGIQTAFHLASCYPNRDESMTPLKRSVSPAVEGSYAGNGSVIVSELAMQDCSLWSASYSGINLYASVVLRPGILPARAPQIALVALVALGRVIENMTSVRPQLLWPNALTSGGKLLAKVKTTMQSNIERINFLVLGFEVNINGIPEELEEGLSSSVTSMRRIAGKVMNRPLLAATLFRELEKWYVTYINKGTEKILREVNHFFSYDKKETRVFSGKTSYCGVIEGLDPEGVLLLRTAQDEIIRIPAGSVGLNGKTL